jgi:cysteine synthase
MMNTTAKQSLENTVQRCRDRHILIPTFSQLADPSLIPEKIRQELEANIGREDLHPLNLFRITWKNDPKEPGGGFGGVNHLALPRELTGTEARIIVLLGKYFPTGSHKVGATYGALVDKLVNGHFDPTWQKALWPSTGNYCRGGAYNANLLSCPSVAVLPEEMSSERFDWLRNMGSEIIKTPGGESNVKEIFDKVNAMTKERGDEIVILNQFSDFGNSLWHYIVTGPALEEVFKSQHTGGQRLSALFLTQGSAGTLAAGEYLRGQYPLIKIGAGEALQCPTLLYNGHGFHRIEGIGDKHVPWIFNIRNIDLVAGIDDESVMRIMRLFNESVGQEHLTIQGVAKDVVIHLSCFGLSSIANILGAIKMAKYYEFTSQDVVLTVATDSMDLYQSRMEEARSREGEYAESDAVLDHEGRLVGVATDHILEPSYHDKKRMHNLKYFTWVEQQGMSVEELDAQWYDQDYWMTRYARASSLDSEIDSFNERTGVLTEYL